MASDESALLFQETASFSLPRGLGVWHKPATGGSYRSVGGQFVFISGRPYRYDPEHLRSNIEFILSVLFQEASSSSNGYASDFVLEQNYPNPFTTLTAIRYYLSHQAEVTIKIYNIQGELVRSLCDKRSISAGFQNIVWDGKRADGTGVGTGVYLCQLNCGKSSQVKKMLMLK